MHFQPECLLQHDEEVLTTAFFDRTGYLAKTTELTVIWRTLYRDFFQCFIGDHSFAIMQVLPGECLEVTLSNLYLADVEQHNGY